MRLPSAMPLPTTILYIKHMVCARGIRVVKCLLAELGLTVLEVRLGLARVAEPADHLDLPRLRATLQAAGFALLEDPRVQLTERVQRLIAHLLRTRPRSLAHSFSVTLARHLDVGYAYLSQAFSQKTGLTLEQYIKQQRIEQAKELLTDHRFSITQVARKLGYSSISHLSGQFRSVAGCTPSAYRQQFLPRAILTLEQGADAC